ncbi:putative integral membrane protein [Rhodococcus sp. AW25M09]|nr:putative integral membrane protein [Rhodococcus sp. AW25M09]
MSVGAFAGLICVLFALAAVFLGITPLIFRSGSMAPAIETGALALSKKTPATEIQVGDIVNVTNAAGNGITHRVIEIGAVGTDSAQLILQGDANSDADVETYIVSEAGRVIFSVPKLGYAVTWLSGPVAVFLGGILVGVLLMLAFRPESRREAEPDGVQPEGAPRPRHSKSPLTVVLAIAAVSAVGISASNTPTTLAAGVDTATALSGTFTTAPPLLPPTSLTCANSGLSQARLSWPTAGTGYTYQYVMRLKGSSTIVATVPIAASQLSVTIVNGALINIGALDGVYTYKMQTVSGSHVSAEGPSRDIKLVPGLVVLGVSVLPSASCDPTAGTSSVTAGAAARSAPQALTVEPPSITSTSPIATTDTAKPEATTSSATTPETTTPEGTTPTEASTTTEAPSTTTEAPSTTTEAPTTTTESLTTTPPAPVDLITPQSSPSGASTARVVDIDGAQTLQIVDTTGAVQYSAPATSSDAYGYGVQWSGDQLWLLGPDQLVWLDGTGGSWSRTVIDPADTDQIPADILALLQ